MATNDCSPVKFIRISETAFYFEVADMDGDIEEDNFEKSQCEILQHLIGDKNDKFLILNADEEFQVQRLTMTQQSQPDYKFNIQFYKDSSLDGRQGRAVILYVNKDDKKMVACCSENDEILPEEMDLPQEIGESAHKAVFYQIGLKASNKFLLESSLHQSKFIGFRPAKEDSTVSKLVLVSKGKDEVDESCHLHFS